jgi:hypothetical protein
VGERLDVAGLAVGAFERRLHGCHDPLGLVVRCAGRLGRDEPPVDGEDDVGERPADVDPKEHTARLSA